jgi:hypothetical protein
VPGKVTHDESEPPYLPPSLPSTKIIGVKMKHKPCFAPGCTRQVHPARLMCLRHWRSLTAATRAEVIATWGAYQASPGHEARRAYLEARGRAAREVAP